MSEINAQQGETESPKPENPMGEKQKTDSENTGSVGTESTQETFNPQEEVAKVMMENEKLRHDLNTLKEQINSDVQQNEPQPATPETSSKEVTTEDRSPIPSSTNDLSAYPKRIQRSVIREELRSMGADHNVLSDDSVDSIADLHINSKLTLQEAMQVATLRGSTSEAGSPSGEPQGTPPAQPHETSGEQFSQEHLDKLGKSDLNALMKQQMEG